ncbi:MAG: SRPBCC family protein [Myxococcales bacterium]|nr:SRPBCC family protein [Myxococcales bacterium]
MAIAVTVVVEIARDADEVFAYLANFENNPAWQGGMVSARFVTEPPLGVGSQYVQRARFMGRPIETHFEVTAFEQGRSISIASLQSTFPIQVTREVTPIDSNRCRVKADVRGEPAGVFKMAAPLMRRMVSRSVNGDYQALKKLLETASPKA